MPKSEKKNTQHSEEKHEHKCCCHSKNEEAQKAEEAHECCCNGEGDCNEGTCACETSELETLKAQLAQAQADAKKNHDNFLRSLADLDTFRRRVQRDMEDLRKFAIQPLVEELIPALDNLELGLDHAKKDEKSSELAVGIEMVQTQIKKALQNFAVLEVCPIGQDFDPNLHECVAHTPSEEVEENKVLSLVRKGYTLNGRLVRPATVVVSSGKAQKE